MKPMRWRAANCAGTAALLSLLVLSMNACQKSANATKDKFNRKVAAKLEAIRQAGHPVTPAELNAWYSLQELLAAAQLPIAKYLEASVQWPEQLREAKDKGYFWTTFFMGPLQGTAGLVGELVGLRRATKVGLAIERYRLAHSNVLPENLSQLVPEFLEAVPDDPFDGKPLRYTKLPKGFVVYCIGLDRKDNGGTTRKRSGARTDYDIIFHVQRQ
jgi:hypothetical protein